MSSVAEQVEKLAKIAKEMERRCSMFRTRKQKSVRKIIGPDLLIFTPGIRMHGNDKDDQQRVCTPMESIKNGSDKLIMGRGLIKGNIEDNLNRIFKLS